MHMTNRPPSKRAGLKDNGMPVKARTIMNFDELLGKQKDLIQRIEKYVRARIG
jgi:hypothetical protein